MEKTKKEASIPSGSGVVHLICCVATEVKEWKLEQSLLYCFKQSFLTRGVLDQTTALM